MQYAHITEFYQFDLNEHIVRCRFTEMGVTESYCNSVESSSFIYFFALFLSNCSGLQQVLTLITKNYR